MFEADVNLANRLGDICVTIINFLDIGGLLPPISFVLLQCYPLSLIFGQQVDEIVIVDKRFL